MKKITFTLFLVVSTFMFADAQTTEITQEINTPIESAIVYLYGAEVSHSKQVTISPGRNKIVFTGLSPKLDARSIQVSVSGNISILAISDAMNFIDNQKESARIIQLKDSARTINEMIAQINNDKEAYMIEKNMLLKNESIGSAEKGVTISELKLAADFYRNRIKEINAEVFKLDKKVSHIKESLVRVNKQLNELNVNNNQPTSEISILLSSATKTTSLISLKYIVTDAGWAPSYDLHAEDINKPIVLKYRAKVFNNTGVDWNNIAIKLSTADPSQSASKPILTTWKLDYLTTTRGYYSNSQSKSKEGYMQNTISDMKQQAQKPVTQNEIQPIEFEEIQVSELSAEFDIKIKYSIPANSKPYIVDVTEYQLPATYQHFSVPKLDRDAFLLARITGWEDLDLVEGPSNVYFAGTYVGQSYIYTRSADDTLDLSLGRDNKVLVTRTKVKEFSSRKFFGNTTKETFAYEMVIKNNRKTAININVQDQLPISVQGDISVESIEISKAEQDVKTGKLTWSYHLQPGEVKKIVLSFAVKYPKNTQVSLQKTNKKMRAKF